MFYMQRVTSKILKRIMCLIEPNRISLRLLGDDVSFALEVSSKSNVKEICFTFYEIDSLSQLIPLHFLRRADQIMGIFIETLKQLSRVELKIRLRKKQWFDKEKVKLSISEPKELLLKSNASFSAR